MSNYGLAIWALCQREGDGHSWDILRKPNVAIGYVCGMGCEVTRVCQDDESRVNGVDVWQGGKVVMEAWLWYW
ncbi:hypothetical protein PIB30_010181 [Stylosanthes scabra]|uniref:Uncharacterized protein n=1 Tax=Stylosanthes scabra TaxID=79078 RepID=A0ABU6R6H6_9FABA|nr:hypothetical protein [Stylosanthes scabra]